MGLLVLYRLVKIAAAAIRCTFLVPIFNVLQAVLDGLEPILVVSLQILEGSVTNHLLQVSGLVEEQKCLNLEFAFLLLLAPNADALLAVKV